MAHIYVDRFYRNSICSRHLSPGHYRYHCRLKYYKNDENTKKNLSTFDIHNSKRYQIYLKTFYTEKNDILVNFFELIYRL